MISKVLDTNRTRSHGQSHSQRLCLGPTHLGPSLTAAAQPGLLLWHPAMKTIIQMEVMTKQKTETNITHPRGLGGLTWVDATRIHTRPPNTWNTGLVRKANAVALDRWKIQALACQGGKIWKLDPGERLSASKELVGALDFQLPSLPLYWC